MSVSEEAEVPKYISEKYKIQKMGEGAVHKNPKILNFLDQYEISKMCEKLVGQIEIASKGFHK